MSHRSSENSRDYGRSRSSSSSSTTSSTSSSSSSPPTSRQRRRNRRSNRSRTRSRSRTSSTSTRSRSPSNERRRGRYSDPMDSDEDNNHVAADLRASRREKDQSSAAAVAAASHHESSPIDRHRKIDDSIRSDKSSEAAESNGRAVGAPVSAAATAAPTATVSATSKGTAMGQAPPKRTISAAVQFGRPGTVVRPCIQMKLGQPKPPTEPTRKITVASAFNNDSDDEVEEMPPECKMRMRNIGRDTPTSSGPNSFGKTKQGFIDSKKLFEKSLREAALE